MPEAGGQGQFGAGDALLGESPNVDGRQSGSGTINALGSHNSFGRLAATRLVGTGMLDCDARLRYFGSGNCLARLFHTGSTF